MKEEKNTVQYRYPGVIPFSTAQNHLFFGREQDTNDLCKRIYREQLVVVYGKSGLGKSSLINAGIIPKMINDGEYTPTLIRFGTWTATTERTPLDIAKDELKPKIQANTFLSNLLPEDDTLWFHAKNRQWQGKGKPLLIFDQFEELFSYPEAEQTEFKKGLSELLYTDLPLRFRRKLEIIEQEKGFASDQDEDLLELPLNARVLFAIRSDRLHLLDRVKDFLPGIFQHAYELKALTIEGAKTAITSPARISGNFITPTFEFTDAVVKKLLDFLVDKEDNRVEGILIQMLCDHYEKEQVGRMGIRILDLPQVGDPSNVIKNYYDKKINSLPEANRLAARLLIEDGLVTEGEGLRLNLHEAFIFKEYNINKELLERLVNNRLLRAEPFIRGGYNYELAHDRLVPAVLSAKMHRKEIEAEKKRLAEAERITKQAELDRLEKENAKSQLRIVRSLLGIVFVAFLLAGYFGLQANWEKRAALVAEDKANTERKRAERISAKWQLKEFNSHEERIRQVKNQNIDNAPPKGLLREMREFANTYPDTTLTFRLNQLIKQYNLQE